LILQKCSWFSKSIFIKLVYTGFSNEHPGEKNYGLGIELLTGKQDKTFISIMVGGTETLSFITLQKRVTIIALSNLLLKPIKRKLSKLFGDYPFKLGDDDKEE
jgi:hypothetical protein